jgi:nucleoside-triphosphatase
MKLLIAGRPGSGKTTLCRRVIQALGDRMRIGGIITEEVRERGVRRGFKIRDLMTGMEMVLADVGLMGGPRVGKYRVNMDALSLGEQALLRATEQCDLIVIDEVGHMELKSPAFAAAVAKAFNSQRHVMATMPLKAGHKIINELKERQDIHLIEINPGNRDAMLKEILERFEK